MDEKIRSALAELNRVFYANFAGDFAATRQNWLPSFDRILPHFRRAANVLDVGCGNGRLRAFLRARGWCGRYVGLDNSAGLLVEAAKIGEPATALMDADQNVFLAADLLSPAWPAQLTPPAPDLIALLAVLHHIPGAAQRGGLLAQCARLLAPGGRIIVSTWQFLSSPRLRARILPWSAAGLQAEDVEPGDYLLSWGAGAAGQRYCAAIGVDDLCGWAAEADLECEETFTADGQAGNLNLYGIFRRP